MALHLIWNDVQSCQKVLHKAEASLYHYAVDWTSFSYTSIMKLQLMYLDQAPTSTFALAVLSARNSIGDILANISMPYSVVSFRPLLTLPRSPFLSKFLKLFIWDSKMMITSSVVLLKLLSCLISPEHSPPPMGSLFVCLYHQYYPKD